MTRTEEWTKEFDGMLSTLVVDVHDGERVDPAVVGDRAMWVLVSDQVEHEFGLTGGVEDVDPWREKFNRWHPYNKVSIILAERGWSRAVPS